MTHHTEAVVGAEGELRLKHLPFVEGEPVSVIVTSHIEGRPWPKRYFEETFGSIRDESFSRHPQGEFERREELD